MYWFTLVLLSLLLVTTYSSLKVISPDNVKSKVSNNAAGIGFQVVRSSRIPYGSNLIGTLVLADPEDGCSTIDTSFKSDVNIQVPIIVVKRGGCSLKAKTKYAQLAGAKMVIILDDLDVLPKTPIGVGQDTDISIQTILIAKKEGDELYETIKPKSSESSGENKKTYVVISITFPYGAVSDHVEVDLWFSSSDKTSGVYKFLREFKSYYLQSKDSFKFHPHYMALSCTSCKQQGFKEPNRNCLSGGRYCAHDPDSDGPLAGSDVVKENLRQMCLWTTVEDKWWDYVDTFETNCVSTEKQEECSKKTLEAILTSSQRQSVEECITSSFEADSSSQNRNEKINDNKRLRDEKLIQEEYDVVMSPSLFINHQIYKDHFDANSVFKAGCESLIKPSSLCQSHLPEYTPARLDVKTITIFICVMLVFVVIILYFYRRMTRREMTKEMSIQVSQMVSQYFAINESKRSHEF